MSESKAGFWVRLSITNTIEGFRETINRFPFASVCSGLLFTLAVFFIADHKFVEKLFGNEENIGRAILLLSTGFFWFGASRLIAEGDGQKSVKDWIVTFGGFAALAAFCIFSSAIEWRLFFFIPAILLMVSFAPYVFKGRDDTSFWFYNRVTWFGVAVAFIGTLLMFGGAAAALASVDYLFGVDIDGDAYGYLWAFAACVLGPIYALSWIPKRFEFTAEDCTDPPGLGFILNWILAPLVIIYMAILYAYFIKILITGDVPQGQLALMIAGFGAAGIITYMIGWPCRESGGGMLKLVMKYFFPALLIPVLMQIYAIFLRVDQYGLTEKRYAIILCAVWFLFLTAGFSFKKLPLRAIPMSLCVLLLLAAWGPWSAFNMSVANQKERLNTLLEVHELVKDNRIVKAPNEVSFEDRKLISGGIDYLGKRKQTLYQYELRPYKNDDLFREMGFAYLNRYDRRSNPMSETLRYNYTGRKSNVRYVEGYDYFIDGFYVYERENERTLHLQDQAITLMTALKGPAAHIQLGEEEIRFDLTNMLKDLQVNSGEARNKKYAFFGETRYFSFKFVVLNANAQFKGGIMNLNQAGGTLMVKEKDKADK